MKEKFDLDNEIDRKREKIKGSYAYLQRESANRQVENIKQQIEEFKVLYEECERRKVLDNNKKIDQEPLI